MGKIFLLSTSSIPVLGPNQLSVQWVLEAFSPGVKRPGHEADHTSNKCRRQEYVALYFHSSYVFVV
jgi:hypothetical protein